jgi:hypothetical protein
MSATMSRSKTRQEQLSVLTSSATRSDAGSD